MGSQSELILTKKETDGFFTNFSHLARISKEHKFYLKKSGHLTYCTEHRAKLQKKAKKQFLRKTLKKGPVDTRRRFNVDTTLYDVVRRRIDVETMSCVYRGKMEGQIDRQTDVWI